MKVEGAGDEAPGDFKGRPLNFKNTKVASSVEAPPEPQAVNIHGPIVTVDPPKVEKASAATVDDALAKSVHSQWTCIHSGELISVDRLDNMVWTLLPEIDKLRRAQDAYYWTKSLAFGLSKEEKKIQAKRASMEILGVSLTRYINQLSDVSLICSL